MLFFFVLAAATSIAWLIGRRSSSLRDHARWGMAVAMVVAGLSHLVNSEPFVQHLPDWVPARELLVYLSGAAEIALGVALVRFAHARRAVGQLLAAYLLAVFPANLYVAVADVDVTGQPGGAYAWIRLPFQALFIAWALSSTSSPSPAPVVSPAPEESRPVVAG
jgi:uncharacterized membrane protein